MLDENEEAASELLLNERKVHSRHNSMKTYKLVSLDQTLIQMVLSRWVE